MRKDSGAKNMKCVIHIREGVGTLHVEINGDHHNNKGDDKSIRRRCLYQAQT